MFHSAFAHEILLIVLAPALSAPARIRSFLANELLSGDVAPEQTITRTALAKGYERPERRLKLADPHHPLDPPRRTHGQRKPVTTPDPSRRSPSAARGYPRFAKGLLLNAPLHVSVHFFSYLPGFLIPTLTTAVLRSSTLSSSRSQQNRNVGEQGRGGRETSERGSRRCEEFPLPGKSSV